MRKPKASVVFMLFILAASLASASQKPVKEEQVFVDYAPPPAELGDMAADAAAIVRATYTGKQRLVETAFPGGATLRWTDHTFQVVEVLKRHHLLPLVGDTLQISLPGGDKEYSTYVLRTIPADTDRLKPNGTYLLFLEWNLRKNELEIAWGPAGIYDITDGTTRSPEQNLAAP